MAHVSQQKKGVVNDFVGLIDKYQYVGAINMENLPAKTVNGMRLKLRDSVLIKMSKRRLLSVALKESKKSGVEKLIPHLKGMPALLFTNKSPFVLFKTLKKNKSTTAIKGGQIAPNDIIIPAGPTSFAPGPVIGELGAVGAKAGIEGGKVTIKADSLVAKEGDVVDAKLAGILTRLGIEPMEIGLDLVAIYEDGEILTKAVLDIDEDAYLNDIGTAAAWAFNLAVNSAYPTTETIEVLLQNAFSESRNLAINEYILTDLTVGDTLAKVHGQMLGLASALPEDVLSEELKAVTASVASGESSSTDNPSTDGGAVDNDKKDEPEKPKADAAAGLGALFG